MCPGPCVELDCHRRSRVREVAWHCPRGSVGALRSVRLFSFVVVWVLLASSARADDDRAKELFDRGTSAFHAGDFPKALTLFREAYAIDPHPILMYNIARSEESLGHATEAVRAFRKYLELAPDAEDRGAVEQRIATLERQLEEKRALELQRDKARRDAEAERKRAARKPKAKAPSPIPWIVAGTGVAIVATGTVLAIIAKQKHDDAEAEKSSLAAEDQDESSRKYARWANVSFAVGGALVLGGTVFGVIDLGAAPKNGAALRVGGRF